MTDMHSKKNISLQTNKQTNSNRKFIINTQSSQNRQRKHTSELD